MMIWPRSGVLDPDQDGGAEPLVEVLLELERGGAPWARAAWAGSLRILGAGRGGTPGGHEGLGLADREALGDDPPAGGTLAFRVGQAEQGAGVTLGDLGVADGVLDLVGQVEQADQVRDGRAVEAEPAGELLLGPAVACRGSRGTRWPSRAR